MITSGGNLCFSLPEHEFIKDPDSLQSKSSLRKKKHDTSFYMRSHNFYDSVYTKSSRKKITKLLYSLAFIAPASAPLADSIQVMKSSTPFEKYSGKKIRNIKIKVLAPFGSTINDTTNYAYTGAGKALNKVHINTRGIIIKHNLLFKTGQVIDPNVLADNERVLRDLSFIDNARIIVTPCDPGSDSVDVTVIAKDVWSIGFDIPIITTKRLVGRVFDANFLGFGDRLTVNLSTELYRSPLFSFDGLSYSFSNIGGSQINAGIQYFANDEGDRNYSFVIERPFLTNRTKWAGSTGISWWKDVTLTDSNDLVTTRFVNQSLWIGRSFLLKDQKEASRVVIAAAAYNTTFFQRPNVTIDSNRGYYNHLQVLGSLSLSKNNYYVTDYVLGFGKVENLPYGHLVQLTVGWDQTDFYDRVYTGTTISAGRFFNRFGYLSGTFSFGGFFNGNSFEDNVFKVKSWYFTPLLRTKDNRFKFRSYVTLDYRYPFNTRTNNLDVFDINQDFKISKVKNSSAFLGVHAFSANFSNVCYTPWFLYGFRFALLVNLQTGLVAPRGEDLIKSPLFSALGVGILIKNDNLVFPTFMIGCYYYPNSNGNMNSFQVYLTSALPDNNTDFNVTAPHEETLAN